MRVCAYVYVFVINVANPAPAFRHSYTVLLFYPRSAALRRNTLSKPKTVSRISRRNLQANGMAAGSHNARGTHPTSVPGISRVCARSEYSRCAG